MKTCRYCKVSLPLSDFTMNKRHKDGKDSYCKKCKSEKHKKTSPEKLKEYRKKSHNKKMEDGTLAKKNIDYYREQIEKISDWYVLRSLTRTGELNRSTVKEIPALIKLRRIQILTKRQLKKHDTENH